MSADATSILHRAEEAFIAINTLSTWKSAVNILQRVMDTVTPIAGVTSISFLFILRQTNLRIVAEPLCKSSMGSALKDSRGASPSLVRLAEHLFFFLSSCCQTLLQLVQRDENIEALLETIRDAFEFAEEADSLRSIKPESKQAKILEEMLECVSESAKFIKSYAEDVQVGTLSSALPYFFKIFFAGKRVLKNMVGQGPRVDAKIEQFRTNLVRLRDSFLARAAVTTEVAVLEAGE
jgi:hypothetical protein